MSVMLGTWINMSVMHSTWINMSVMHSTWINMLVMLGTWINMSVMHSTWIKTHRCLGLHECWLSEITPCELFRERDRSADLRSNVYKIDVFPKWYVII